MTLLRDAATHLVDRGVSFAAIGGAALARHGVARSTLDVDLLATDPRTLGAAFWRRPPLPGVSVEILRGDHLDPLAGVVRLRCGGERPVDLVVGRSRWQNEVLARAITSRILDTDIPVVSLTDLVLLKLYAGGPQDAWDVRQLLEADADGAIAGAVDEGIGVLSAEAAAFWRKIRSE